jgi:predicted Zn-dependent protease with MMP-like domain
MTKQDFDNLVQHVLQQLPRRFKNKLKNITVETKDRPSRKLLKDMGITSGTLFGLYHGVPLTEREWNYANILPDRIVIYQQPIENAALTEKEVETIVRDTVMHEVGHYFGFLDEELHEITKKKGSVKKRVLHR